MNNDFIELPWTNLSQLSKKERRWLGQIVCAGEVQHVAGDLQELYVSQPVHNSASPIRISVRYPNNRACTFSVTSRQLTDREQRQQKIAELVEALTETAH